MKHPFSQKLLMMAIPLALILGATPAGAESYSSLAAKGFKTSTLTKSKAGNLGWNLSDGKSKYFCELGVAVSVLNDKYLMMFSSAGMAVKGDRKAYEDVIGGPDPSLPKYSDLKAGKLTGREVGPCHFTR